MRNQMRAGYCIAVIAALAGTSAGQVQPGNLRIDLEEVVGGLVSPVQLKDAGDGSGRMFVVDQAGMIRIIKNGKLLAKPFLDLTGVMSPLNPNYDEKGLLGMAFHPDYAKNGRFFVRYSKQRDGKPGDPCLGDQSRGCHSEILAEFHVSDDPDVADPDGEELFSVDKPQFNHNGGGIEFGPDGYLYFSLGDGGGANDGLADVPPSHGPIGNAQNIEVPLGKILRVDIDGGSPYVIPADNPFVGKDGLDEIYAWGMRNPYSFSFDKREGGDGALWLGEVGQDAFEEVDLVEKGVNYGWVIKEGFHCFDPFNPTVPPDTCDDAGLTDPIVEYDHQVGIAVVGGYVYRGTKYPEFEGKYLFGDFSTTFGSPDGHLFYIDPASDLGTIRRPRLGADNHDLGLFVKGFGEDQDGEVYVLASGALGPSGNKGVVLHLTAGPCVPDLNADGALDLFDFLAFVNLFNAGDAKADCDGNGALDLFDFLCFVNQFNEGC